jgi:glucose/arabinose dehydrogenase
MRRWIVIAALSLSVPACAAETPLKVETVVEGLDAPWAFDFLPDGRVLVTERSGQLRVIADGQLQKDGIDGVPEVYHAGQGGLLDVLVDRDFPQTQRLFLSYAHRNDDGNATRVISARLDGGALVDVRELFTASPRQETAVHYGGRLLQLPEGGLMLSLGDGFDYREDAQKPDNHHGKIVAFAADGGDAEIWSLGHRNVQGLVRDPESGTIWAHEHGPKGGDEINRIERGGNYGWPVATFGVDYSGAVISPFSSRPGMLDPAVVWVPSIAPSGMAVYRGAMFPQWRGDLFVSALAGRKLVRVRIGDGEPEQEDLLTDQDERLRDVAEGPDGALWILTDGGEAKLLRVTPG